VVELSLHEGPQSQSELEGRVRAETQGIDLATRVKSVVLEV
jgi:hypothetical protein